jgi:PhoH-like ATPase
MEKQAKKAYVLDTNVLIHDPMALYAFSNAFIAIPMVALEELDKFKGETSDRGRNSRDVIRRLDDLRKQGSLREGVKLDNGGVLKILFPSGQASQQANLVAGIPDNDILFSVLHLKNEGYDVCFVSKDLNARVKADALGIHVEDYLKGRVDRDEFYKGWIEYSVPSVQMKREFPEVLQEALQDRKLYLNQFVLVRSQHNPYNYKIFRYIGHNSFKPVYSPKISWNIEPRNPQQVMAFDLLFDESVQLVSLLGPAGTGKTFLAVMAGLYQVLMQDKYDKLLAARPVIPLGPDIGFLPGDLQEKLYQWMQPIYDNVDLIMHKSAYKTPYESPVAPGDKQAKKKKKEKEEHVKQRVTGLDYLIREGKVSLEAITYMRGRSIPFQYILIDEVQNLSPHEVKTIVSRVGQDSKIILAGDPFQIDSPYLDFSSNGLVVSSNAFKGNQLCGTIFLETSERSELSRLASELL